MILVSYCRQYLTFLWYQTGSPIQEYPKIVIKWRSIICKHNARCLHVSRLKASAVSYSFWKTYTLNKMHQLKPGKGAGIWWVMEPQSFSFSFFLNTMILDLYYKPLRTRNLQKLDIFHSKLVSSIISHKHTSLLWNPYNRKPYCFFYSTGPLS